MNLDPDEEWFQKKCRPVFNIPLLTREQLANVAANTVDRAQGELAAEIYLARRPVHISPIIPLTLIGIMIFGAVLVWGRV